MGAGASAAESADEAMRNSYLKSLENAPIRYPQLHSDGVIEQRDEYHEKYAPPKKFSIKSPTTELEIQAAANWHRMLTHVKNNAPGAKDDSDEAISAMLNSSKKSPQPRASSMTLMGAEARAQELKASRESTEVDNKKTQKKAIGVLKGPNAAKAAYSNIKSKLVDHDTDDSEEDDSEDESDFEELGEGEDEQDEDDDNDDNASQTSLPPGFPQLPPVIIVLKSRTSNTVSLAWDIDADSMEILHTIQHEMGPNCKPKYELHYKQHLSVNPDDKDAEPWIMATSSAKSLGGTLKNLIPNTPYVFRCKRSWDKDFGPCVVIRTGPGPPSEPLNLAFKEVTSKSILLSWQAPEKDNGLPITEYIVTMKAWGSENQVVHRGKDRVCFVSKLCPNLVHIFDVVAVNKAGRSPNSEKASVRTLAPGAADITPWAEVIDEKTGRLYYTHPSTGEVSWELPKGALLDENESFRLKRMYLNRKLWLRSRTAANRVGDEDHVNMMEIDRKKLLEQSLQKIAEFDAHMLDAGPIKIHFANEEGLDAGGLSKDWFSQVAKALRSSSSGLMALLPSGEVCIDHRSSAVLAAYEVRWLYKAIGVFMAKAIMDGHTLGLHLSPLLLMRLAGRQPTLHDLQSSEPQYYNGLQYVLNNEVSEMDLTFTCSYELFDETKIAELKDYGISEAVTEENKAEYVDLMIEWLTSKRYEPGITHLLEGFHRHISKDDLKHFRTNEIQMLLGGKQSIDPNDIFVDVRFAGGFTEESNTIKWLRAAVDDMDQKTLSKFLGFITGCPNLPIDGLKPTLLITLCEDGNDSTLPKAHTCFNQLVIPRYSTKEILDEKLQYALDNTADGFFMA